eukprot:scaffold7239_cov123-Skeletonema_dohrnii-CCMP3373.AAC.2
MATETIATTTAPPRSCGHCGKTSSSLLRCSQCKLVYYCSRSCQSLAWKDGHRQACRKAKTSAATSNGGDQSINATMTELMQHVQTMDCRTAYENMCRAQDEIERLQKQLDEMEAEGDVDDEADNDIDDVSIDHLEEGNDDCITSEIAYTDGENNTVSSEIEPSPRNESKEVTEDTNIINIKTAHGSWLDEGGKCSIEYLPNIKCYHITLTTTSLQSSDSIVPNRDDLQFKMSPVPNPCEPKSDCSSSQIVFYEMRLVHSSSSTLLSMILPGSQATNHQDGPTATISTDSQSISLRIYLQMNDSSSMDLMDNLLGMEAGSLFSPVTTPSTDINHLCCRNCQSPIITRNDNNNESTIQSVLPLPSGYWDDIEDYLICYDGQANVDFNTSTMNAIRHVALEDDAVVVLHKDDVNEEDGVCTTRNVKGYGEHSALQNGEGENVASMTSQQLWKDKSAMKGEKGNTITCSNCCCTLGFVSGHDSSTFRFYKHLLHCGTPSSSSSSMVDKKNVFSKYTCGSFLAREMVRYADNEAIYTFIVGVSDENDWTRLSKASECILLHMLSWDSALVGVDGKMSSGGGVGGGDAMQFDKVLKVIYDETIDKGQHSSDQDDDADGSKWTWGGIDLCCPPPSSSMGENEDELFSFSTQPQIKATAVRIFLSTQEWTELKHALHSGSEYFSEVVKDAIVMSKLGMPLNGSRHSASLSYLPLVN